MNKYLEFSNNNIFDIDNLNNLTYNNQSFNNGFIQINKSYSKKNISNKNRNKNIYYTKKKIVNNSNTNRDDLSQIEFANTSSEKFNLVSDSVQDVFKNETLPVFKFNMPKAKSKDKIDNNIRDSIKNFNDMQKIYINKKCVKSFLDSSQYNDKEKSNSSIDEIKISLKKLKIRQNIPKTNSQKNIKVSISRNKPEFNMLNQFINSTHIRHNTEATFKLSKKPNIKNDNLNKNITIFRNLTIQKEGRFNYIGNNNNKINYLEKIISQQKDNIKFLREQNKNLIEKIQKMHEENMIILESINSLRMELDLSYNNKIKDNYRNSYLMDESLIFYNTKNNSQIFEENNLNINQIIYSLYDNNNLLSYDYENNEFKLVPVMNEEFRKMFNKDINSLLLYNNISNRLYIIAGTNNDQLFIYDLNKDKIQTKSTLKNNHMCGSLLLLLNENNDIKTHLICLSGKYNKKVEIYNEENDIWDDKILEEMPEERGDSYYLILNDNYIYAFYGYNYILNKYLNDIVYYDLINNKWKRIMNNLLNNSHKGIKNHICYQNTENKYIYILGGDSNINKIIIDLEKKCVIQFDEGKSKGNYDRFLLNNNFVYNIDNNYLSFFDKNYNVYLIDCSSNENKLIKYY